MSSTYLRFYLLSLVCFCLTVGALAQSEPASKKAAPSAANAAAQSDGDELVVTAAGDVMLGSTFPDATGGELPPNDGVDLLKEVTPFLKEGDVVFGNLEGPLMDGGSSGKCHHKRPGSCYAFRVPTRYGAHLKAEGFNVMGLANNDALDFEQEGRASPRKTLEALGIAHSGEIGDIAWLSVKNKKVAVISFATYPGAHNFLDLDDTVRVIRETRTKADIVIVSFHGGAEGAAHQHVPNSSEFFLGENRGDLRRFAHAAIDAGAQLILGSGPHVVRGMEVYKGKLIAYSLGNFATYGAINVSGVSGLSAVLKARLAADGSFLGGGAATNPPGKRKTTNEPTARQTSIRPSWTS